MQHRKCCQSVADTPRRVCPSLTLRLTTSEGALSGLQPLVTMRTHKGVEAESLLSSETKSVSTLEVFSSIRVSKETIALSASSRAPAFAWRGDPLDPSLELNRGLVLPALLLLMSASLSTLPEFSSD